MTDVPDPSSATPTAPAVAPYPSGGFDRVVAAVRELKHPSQIGPYHIQQLIGEGGMGNVYRAEQREPIQRIVALKVIKLGMDTREVIARFESERQALALMNHPNVAKVLDAGATDQGKPYFVMEYVPGEPITSFADRHKLDLKQRLELFMQACEAVQHAHQKAIIHRDLKPSNILVTLVDTKPQVKVIDFGVAKAVSQRLTEKTLFTQTGQLVGTPEYMAPEQAEANALDVDTRSDVYSLGVVLYELLSGGLPFDATSLRSAGYQEIQRIIREVDPPRPSTRLSSLGAGGAEIALRRQTPLDTLARQLKSELEWIPLKAMRKDRAHRYASPQEMSEDIGNYLAQRPLRAGPESAAYRAQKFLRRNKQGVIAAAVMLALLIGGIVATTWQAVRARRAEVRAIAEKQQADFQRLKAEDAELRAIAEKQQADLQRRKAEHASENLKEVNRFLTDDLLASASPEVTRGRELTVREALDRAAEAVSGRFRDRPMIEAAVRAVIADTYDALGLTEQGLPHARTAKDLFQRELGPDDEATLTATHEVGRELSILGRQVEAEPMLRDTVDRAQRLLGADHPVTITATSSLAMSLRRQERFTDAESLYRQVLDADRRVHGPQSHETAKSLNNLAVLLNTLKRTAEAEPLYLEALEIKRSLLGADHPSTLQSVGNFARVLQDQGKWPEAETMLRQLLADERRVLKDDHRSTTLTMNNLGYTLWVQGKSEEGEALYREALERRRRALGEEDVDTLQSKYNLGNLLVRTQRYAEAEGYVREALDGRRKIYGDKHPHTLNATIMLSNAYARQSKFVEAVPLYEQLCQPDVLARVPVEQQAILVAGYGFCLAGSNQLAHAEPVLLDAHRRLHATNQPDGDAMLELLKAIVKLCEDQNRPAEAAKWREELSAAATTRPSATTQP